MRSTRNSNSFQAMTTGKYNESRYCNNHYYDNYDRLVGTGTYYCTTCTNKCMYWLIFILTWFGICILIQSRLFIIFHYENYISINKYDDENTIISSSTDSATTNVVDNNKSTNSDENTDISEDERMIIMNEEEITEKRKTKFDVITPVQKQQERNKQQQEQELEQSKQLREREQNEQQQLLLVLQNEQQQDIVLNDSSNNNDPKNPPRPHPHAGARDSNGNWGYVANVTALHDWMIRRFCKDESSSTSSCDTYHNTHPFMSQDETDDICSTMPGNGLEGHDGWDVLANIVRVNQSNTLLLPNDNNYSAIPKILCAIYTYDGRREQIDSIAETWGWRCDGFFAASTKTIPYIYNNNEYDVGTVPIEIIDLPHYGEEKYENMWQKTRSILSYMHDNYIHDFDYFFLSGDDTHLIVENLKDFLMDHNSNKMKYGDSNQDGILYAGQKVIYNDHTGTIIRNDDGSYKEYHNGGPGYVISKLTLQLLVNESFPSCNVHEEFFAEDMLLGMCMKQINVDGVHAVDDIGKQLFHHHSSQEISGLYEFYPFFDFWAERYNNMYRAKDLVSPKSVTFHHLKTPQHMKRHHSILYKASCPIGTVLGDALSNNNGE